MSDHALSLAKLGKGNGAFARDKRFVSAADRTTAIGDSAPDPVADAYARGYAEGAEAGAAAVRADAAAIDAAHHRIETALTRMDADETDGFVLRLKDTVSALCNAVLAEAALAPDALARRVKVAAAMFSRASDERVIRLHPADLALVQGRLPDAWHCEPDTSLDRGALRIEVDGAGGVEDGPAQWRAALAEALR